VAQTYQSFVAWRYLLARPRKLSVPVLVVAGALFVAAIVCAGVAFLVLEAPDPKSVLPTGSPYRRDLILAAACLAAVGELALVLAAIRYFFTFFTTVSVAGVTVGSMALVAVLSVMSGFENDLRDKILGSNAHMLVTKEQGEFSEYRQVAAALAEVPGVVASTPYSSSEVVIAANSNYANVIIKGIDPRSVSKVTDLQKNLDQHRALERLWPLADDGGIRGPPEEEPEDAGSGQDGGAAPDASAMDATDPAPPDFGAAPGDVAPLDLSGGESPLDLSGGEGPAEWPAIHDAQEARPRETGETPPDSETHKAPLDGETDEAPPDMDVGGDTAQPPDLSGGEPGAEGEPDDDGGVYDGLTDSEAEEAMAKFGTEIEGAEVDVFDLGRDSGPAPRIPPRIAKLPGVLVGSELVKQLHLYVGEEVRLISPLAEDTPAGPVPRTAWYRVAGTFFTGMYEYDLKSVYVDLASLQDFLDLGDQVNGIEVRVEDPDDTGPVLARVEARLGPGYRVQDWKEINRNLFSALKLEKIAMFLVLAIVILVASFSIIGNLIMVVVEKAKEIALLKTLGSSNGGVMKIFVVQGLLIGIVGTCVGVLHGLVLALLLAVFGWPLDPDVYYIDRLPIHVESPAVMAVVAAGIVISVLATLYPAYMAARLRPVEGLRYE